MSEKLSKVKEVVAGHYFSYKTFFFLLFVTGASTYIAYSYGRDAIMQQYLVPAAEFIKTIPFIGPYIASWRFDQILLFIIGISLGAFVGWFYGKPRTEQIDVTSTSQPAAAENITAAASEAKETVKETVETAGKTKAELLEDIERITQAIKELKD